MRMVTRTLVFASVNAMTADLSTMKIETKVFTFSGNLTAEDDILKEIKANNETENLKILSIVKDSIKKESVLYGMSEVDFLKYASRMDSRTKISTEETDEE